MMMPFGKHKGEEVASIPHGYLRWLRKNVDLYTGLDEEIQMVLGEVEGQDDRLYRILRSR